MSWMITALGAGLVMFALVDLFTTAVSVGHGAGPVAHHLSRWTWRGLLRLRRTFNSPRLLIAGGPLILIIVISVWVLLLILGWSLVFGQPDTLLEVQDDKPVPALGRVRYAAAIVIGRGSSAVQPAGGIYEVLEPIAAMTGLTVLSLSIAYVLPVVQGVVTKRSLALYINTLGHTPSEILRRAWNGTDLGHLDLHWIALTPRVAHVAQNHLAYPVIHYFHSAKRSTALGPAIVALDQALAAHDVLDSGARIDATAAAPLRDVIDDFVDTLRLAFVEPAAVEVSEGDDRLQGTLDQLREAGIPLDQDARRELSEEEVSRTRLLRGYLADDGWNEDHALDMLPGS